jgi:hypothetical protein
MWKAMLLGAVTLMLVVAISPTVTAAPKKAFEEQCARNPTGTFQEGASKSPKDDTCTVIISRAYLGNSFGNSIIYDDTVEYQRDGSTTLLDRTVYECVDPAGLSYNDPYNPECAIEAPDPYPPLADL